MRMKRGDNETVGRGDAGGLGDPESAGGDADGGLSRLRISKSNVSSGFRDTAIHSSAVRVDQKKVLRNTNLRRQNRQVAGQVLRGGDHLHRA